VAKAGYFGPVRCIKACDVFKISLLKSKNHLANQILTSYVG
jgi:hypothetical protein